MNERVKDVLESILAKFESGEVPQAIAYSVFPRVDIPSAKWSLLNRLLMAIHNTWDARGIKQWNEVGRHVKKGAKAFHILAPKVIKKTAKKEVEEEVEEVTIEGTEPEKLEEEKILVGFLTVPVFRVEDTEGEPLAYEAIKVPELPLAKVAEVWGIPVKGIPWDGRFYGYFYQTGCEIALASEEETVFFHELAHAAHQRVLGEKLKPGQDWKQEIVAELSAAVLCNLYGKNPSRYLGNNYRYISRYAEEANLMPVKACLEVLKDVERVLELIISQASN